MAQRHQRFKRKDLYLSLGDCRQIIQDGNSKCDYRSWFSDDSDGMLIGVDAQQDAQGLYGRSIATREVASVYWNKEQKKPSQLSMPASAVRARKSWHWSNQLDPMTADPESEQTTVLRGKE